jgi:hypothetical protein
MSYGRVVVIQDPLPQGNRAGHSFGFGNRGRGRFATQCKFYRVWIIGTREALRR